VNFVLDASVALLWLVPRTQPCRRGLCGFGTARRSRTRRLWRHCTFALETANVVAWMEGKGMVLGGGISKVHYFAGAAR